MPTINDYKKKALNDAGYSGDINTAEWKWLKDICDPYVGAIPDMWRYAIREAGYSNQNDMLVDLGHTGTLPNKWYKYWRDTPLEGVEGDPLARFDQLNGDWPGGDLAPRRNIWQYTENLASNRYSVSSATKQTETVIATVNGQPVTLTRVTAANFFSLLFSNANGLGLTPFTAGKRYLVSCFVYTPADVEGFYWQRSLANSGTAGHGARFLTNRVRRVWSLAQATTTSLLDLGGAPLTDLGSGSGSSPHWFFKGGDGLPATTEVYVGGFQIEQIADGYDDGVAIIGDSTMQGAALAVDLQSSVEVSRWIEGLLNVTCFNRAVSGEQTDAMDARWATDITPLAQRCKYAIIQGGVNDFANSRALASVQASVTSLHDKAIADGLTPVHLTCTPSSGIVDVPADEANRKAFNSWLLASDWNVVDIAAVIDPSNSGEMLSQYWGSGPDKTHYNAVAKRAIGIAIASASFWSFTRPTPYQKITAATYP